LGLDLLAVGHEYLMGRLVKQVEEVLVEKISMENVFDLYHTSYEMGAFHLNLRCAMFFLSYYDTLPEEPSEKLRTLIHLLENVDPKLVAAVSF